MDPSYRFTLNDKDRFTRLGKRYKGEPYKFPTFNEGYPGLRLEYREEDVLYILSITNINTGRNIINSDMTRSADITSASALTDIFIIWRRKKLLLVEAGRGICCTIRLHPRDYWIDNNGNIDIDKFIEFSEIIQASL